jgi:large subunit ribosomal protein L15
MQIHELKPTHKSRNKKRVGRGGKKGTYSGKGLKGQSSRAGRKMVPIIREYIKRYPKLKGYRRFVMPEDTVEVSLDILDKKLKDGDIANPENLVKMGIAGTIKGKIPLIKILGNGKISKKIIVEKCKLSKSAKDAIEKAGGNIK